MDTRQYLNGKSKDGYKFFGSHKKEKGYIFRILAPNASRVEVIGDFNDWKGQSLRRYSTGVFSITVKNAKEDDRYQYIVYDRDGRARKKLDPFSKSISTDENCSLVAYPTYKFKNKKISNEFLNIYQVHLGSLLKDKTKTIKEHYENLISHAKENKFTHIYLLPLTEYRDYKSMGYASIGLFALSQRYGSIDVLKEFIDKCHKEYIGVIAELDLGEFDPDSYYLSYFDGMRLYDYDYDDIRYNYYGSMNFDYSKNASRSYLLSVVNFWLEEFLLDGISIANAENIIYWQGDKNRGINQAAKGFLEETIKLIKNNKALALASFNGIYDLDLDFDYVYDYAMRAIIRILQRPAYQRNSYKKEVFSLINSDNSKKILGYSYIDAYLDEASLAMKMYGMTDKYDQLKALLVLTYSLNSAKMLFMGDEIGDLDTFSVYKNIDFNNISKDQINFNNFYKDLASLCKENKVLSSRRSSTKILDISGYSIYAYIIEDRGQKLLIVVNLTDIEYSIKSSYKLNELINTHNLSYGSSGNINGSIKKDEKIHIQAYGAAIFEIKKETILR